MNEQKEFINTIEKYISEIKAIKDTDSWKIDYEIMYEKLLDILDILNYNIDDAKTKFQNMIISKYDSFNSYIYNNDVNKILTTKGINERTKTLRAKRKNNLCPDCSGILSVNDNTILCLECGYTRDIKSSLPVSRLTNDNSKHIYKQIDSLIGIKKAPLNISRIIQYISKWLTEYKYIYEWLKFNNNVEAWIEKYKSITHKNITNFDIVIDRIPENAYSYELFKIFTDELYKMLEYYKRLSKLNISNMESLDDEEIILIFEEYYAQYNKVPDFEDKITIDDNVYEIGLYVISLKLTIDKTPLKERIEEILNTELTFPGLMFNFNDVYSRSTNVPKKYNFTQEYVYCIHETFNTQYLNIDKQDKDIIVNIIMRFNEFYKNSLNNKNKSEHNSPLFCCTISCLISQLKYFHKYIHLINFIPSKSKGTSDLIKSYWFNFINKPENKDIIEQYKNNIVNKEDDNNEDNDDNSEVSYLIENEEFSLL